MERNDGRGDAGGGASGPVPHARSLAAPPAGFRLAHRLIRPGAWREGSHGRLLVLHGFLGSGRNWSAVARGLVRTRPDWEAVLVDLRLHGESVHALPPHDIEACARDVVRLAASLRGPADPLALLGHSFGGKVALAATARLDPPPVQAWIVDGTPSPAGDSAGAHQLLDLALRHAAGFADRRAGADAVEAGGFPRFLAEWMATNLVRRGGRYVWRWSPRDMQSLLDAYARTDLWPLVEEPPPGAELRFIRATRDSILAPEDAARIARRESQGEPVRLHHLEGGHWLNVDQPGGLVDLLRRELPRN